jgi:uncharacterized cupin superfamily protein
MAQHIPRRRRRRRSAALGAGVLTLSACLAHSALDSNASPPLIDIRIEDLTKLHHTPVEDTDYWKVVGSQTRPLAASLSTYVTQDRRFDAGVSQYERMTLELRDWPIDEFMYIVEGQVEITATGGAPRLYGPGDAFVMPKGFHGTWRQHSHLKKIQVSYLGATP